MAKFDTEREGQIKFYETFSQEWTRTWIWT